MMRAAQFTAKEMAPITLPQYDSRTAPHRGFDLALLLADGNYADQTAGIPGYALDCFPYGNRGWDGGRCAHDAATILMLSRPPWAAPSPAG